jgi:hypothetical protein
MDKAEIRILAIIGIVVIPLQILFSMAVGGTSYDEVNLVVINVINFMIAFGLISHFGGQAYAETALLEEL